MSDLQIAPLGVILLELQPIIVVVFYMIISDFANCNSVLEILYLPKYEGAEIPITYWRQRENISPFIHF